MPWYLVLTLIALAGISLWKKQMIQLQRERDTRSAEYDAINKRIDFIVKQLEELGSSLQELVQADRVDGHDAKSEKAVTSKTVEAASSLETVICCAIWTSRAFIRDVVKVPDSVLEAIPDAKKYIAPAKFWPTATAITIEVWSTHTVVFQRNGTSSRYYEHFNVLPRPFHLCRHDLPTDTFDGGGSLDVVIYDGAIRFWAVGGPFGIQYTAPFIADDDHTYVDIPLQLDELLRLADAGECELLKSGVPQLGEHEFETPDDGQTGWWLFRKDFRASRQT